MKKKPEILIGTSGWHYFHWVGTFYPPEIKGYYELKYYAERFNTVENNASFYRISRPSTYQTWDKMTPPGFVFSLKLNKAITHVARLELTDGVRQKTVLILESIQTLGEKLGAIVIQLPPSFKVDYKTLKIYLTFLKKEIAKLEHKPDIAIEFRSKDWFVPKTYEVLKKSNVALVAAQSSRYPEAREVTADFIYIRMHGPEKLFASKYSEDQLADWAKFIKTSSKKIRRAYIYFNNDFHGYALENAKELESLLA